MAGYVALGDNRFLGTLTNGTADLENGQFVVPNWATGVGAVPATDAEGDGDVLFVVNEVDSVAELFINDVDFKIALNEYLKGKYPQKGEILVTTKFTGTLAVGDVVAVGNGGILEAIASRTPKIKFAVKEVTTYLGADALSVVVL